MHSRKILPLNIYISDPLKLKRDPSAPPIKFYYGDCLKNQRRENRPKKDRITYLFNSGVYIGLFYHG